MKLGLDIVLCYEFTCPYCRGEMRVSKDSLLLSEPYSVTVWHPADQSVFRDRYIVCDCGEQVIIEKEI